jgi:hypothetical protein
MDVAEWIANVFQAVIEAFSDIKSAISDSQSKPNRRTLTHLQKLRRLQDRRGASFFARSLIPKRLERFGVLRTSLRKRYLMFCFYSTYAKNINPRRFFMDNALAAGEADFRLTFDKQMTFAFATELEDRILDALRRYKHVEVDLSKVKEVDLYGAHLLGLLQSFFGKGLVLIGTSPAVDKAYRQFLAPICIAKAPRPANRLSNTTALPKKRNALSTSYEDRPQG